MKIKEIGTNSYTVLSNNTTELLTQWDIWMENNGFEKCAEENSYMDDYNHQPYIKKYGNEEYAIKYYIDKSHIYDMMHIQTGKVIETIKDNEHYYNKIDRAWNNDAFKADCNELCKMIAELDDGYESLFGMTREERKRKNRRSSIFNTLFFLIMYISVLTMMISTGAKWSALVILTLFGAFYLFMIWKY